VDTVHVDDDPAPDTHQRWVTTVVSAALVGTLGWMLISDRARIADEARTAHQMAADASAQIQVVKAQLLAIDASLQRLERNQERVLEVVERRKP
jgi:hypothetical protein